MATQYNDPSGLQQQPSSHPAANAMQIFSNTLVRPPPPPVPAQQQTAMRSYDPQHQQQQALSGTQAAQVPVVQQPGQQQQQPVLQQQQQQQVLQQQHQGQQGVASLAGSRQPQQVLQQQPLQTSVVAPQPQRPPAPQHPSSTPAQPSVQPPGPPPPVFKAPPTKLLLERDLAKATGVRAPRERYSRKAEELAELMAHQPDSAGPKPVYQNSSNQAAIIQSLPDPCWETNAAGEQVLRTPSQVLLMLGDMDSNIVKDVLDRQDSRNAVLRSAIWTLDVSDTFQEYADILEAYDIEEHAALRLARIANRGLGGQAEASKIIQHLLWTGMRFQKSSTAWLMTACQQAEDYLSNPEQYEGDSAVRPRNNNELRYQEDVPRYSGSSSSSGAQGMPPIVMGAGDPWEAWQVFKNKQNS